MKEMFKPDMIKATVRMIKEMYAERNSIMYQVVSVNEEEEAVEEVDSEKEDASDQSSSDSDENL